MAISAFLAKELAGSDGARYLSIYGLLQAFFIQQDAAIHLCESLEVKATLDKYPKLLEIRKIRNESIGHPTKKDKPRPTSYHWISRPTLRYEGFQYASFHSDGNLQFKDVSIRDLISDQRRYLIEILTSVIEELERRDMAHKERFRMEKLASIFADSLSYSFQKVVESTHSREPVAGALGLADLEPIRRALGAFREALVKRSIELNAYPSIKYRYDLIEYPLAELQGFFQSVEAGVEPAINEKAAYIFAFFLKEKVDELRKMAEAIDDDYAN